MNIGDLIPALAGLTGAELTVTGGGILVLLIIAFMLPDRWRPFYLRPYVCNLRKQLQEAKSLRDEWKARWESANERLQERGGRVPRA